MRSSVHSTCLPLRRADKWGAGAETPAKPLVRRPRRAAWPAPGAAREVSSTKALGLIASLITGIVAGLLLVGLITGWYLMRAPVVLAAAPVSPTPIPHFNTSVPFSQWTRVGTFPTLWGCEAHRVGNERCVSAADPRLWW